MGRLYGIPGQQVLDYLAGSCSGRTYFVTLPPRAQPLLPALAKAEAAVPLDAEAATTALGADAKRDWKRGITERCETPAVATWT